MPKYTYNIECPCLDGWNAFKRHQTLSYCQGYMDALRGHYPRQHLRLVRSDGKVMEEIEAYESVTLGMTAGWPTPEQYERAAEEALERARIIRKSRNPNDLGLRTNQPTNE